tara:strand:- start:326 stop:1033 length:708 start_codon:yes stop_codon:yes gene_type:complete
MVYIKSSFFYIGYIVSGFIFGLLACLFFPPFPLKLRIKFLSAWPRFTNWLLDKICGVKVKIEGKENIPKPPFVIVSNHQGQWETFYFQYLFYPLTTILKRELLFIPFWGWALALLKPISINRNNPKESLNKVLKEGKIKIEEGFLILFFPEGTRNSFNEVGKYARSAFEVAKRSGVPVLPVVHNSGKCWPAHKFLKFPGNIILKIGHPLDVGFSTKETSSLVEEWARTEVSKMKE